MLRSQILYKANITPENYEEPQKSLLSRVLELQRRYEVIEATSWTFDELDKQDRRQVDQYITYRSIKGRIEEEQQKRQSKK